MNSWNEIFVWIMDQYLGIQEEYYSFSGERRRKRKGHYYDILWSTLKMFSSTYRCTNTEQQLIWGNWQVKYYKPSALSGRSSEWVWYSTASEDGVTTVGLHFVAECKSSDCSVFSRFMSDASSLLGRVTVQCSPCTTYLLSAVCIATVGIQTQYFVSVPISETSDKSVRP